MAGLGAFADLVPDDGSVADGILPTVRTLETGGTKNPDTAVSKAGAVGRNQIMPNTAIQYGYDPSQLTNGPYNDQAARTILSDLADRFGGNRDAILAGYNGGPGRGAAFVKAGNDPIVLPQETQDYLAKAAALPPPPATNDQGGAGAFSDLVPGGAPAAGAFADLVPKAAPNDGHWHNTPQENADLDALEKLNPPAAQPGIGDRIMSWLKDATTTLPNQKAPESGWGETILKGLQNIPAGIEKTAAGLVESSALTPPPANIPGLDNPNDAQNPENSPIAPMMAKARAASPQVAFAKKMAAAADAHIKENAPNVAPLSAKALTGDLVNGLITMVPAMAASYVTKSALPMAAMVPQMAVTGYGDKYAESIAAGRTPEQASSDATFSAAANALPAMLPVHALMKPGQKFLGRVFTTAFSVAAQNEMTTALQTGYDIGVLHENMTWGQAAAALTKAGIVGLASGAVFGAIPMHGAAQSDAADRAAALGAKVEINGKPPPPPPGGPDGGGPPPPPPPGGAAGVILDPNAPKPALGGDGVPLSAGGRAVPMPGGIRIAGRRGPNAGVETLIPGGDAFADLVPAAKPPAPPAGGLQPIHDPVTWAQTGWRDAKGNVLPLDAATPTPTNGPTAAAREGFKTGPAQIAGEHDAEMAQIDATGAKMAMPALAPKDIAAKALLTNIDPMTGQKPKGNVAIRELRARMQAVVDAPDNGVVKSVSNETNQTPATLESAQAAQQKEQENQRLGVRQVPERPGLGARILSAVRGRGQKGVAEAPPAEGAPGSQGGAGQEEGGRSSVQPVVRPAGEEAGSDAAIGRTFDPTPHLQPLIDRIKKTDKPLNIPAIAKDFGLTPEQANQVVAKLASRPSSETGAKITAGKVITKGKDKGTVTGGALRRTPIFQAPSDFAGYIAANGGIRDDEGHDLIKGRGLQQMVSGHGPLIRPTGMSIDAAGELTHQEGFFGPPKETPRPSENQVLQKLEQTRRGADNKPTKVFKPEDQADQMEAARAGTAADEEAAARSDILAHAKEIGEHNLTDSDVQAILDMMGRDNLSADAATENYSERLGMKTADENAGEAKEENYGDIPWETDAEAAQAEAGRAAGESSTGRPDQRETAGEIPEGSEPAAEGPRAQPEEGGGEVNIPRLKPHVGSWMAVDRETGKAVQEFHRDSTAVKNINFDKYKLVPADEYLAGLNKPAQAEAEIGATGHDQTLVPGTARSAKQLAAAREDAAKGKIRPKAPQADAGGMFAPKLEESGDMFATKPVAEEKKPATPAAGGVEDSTVGMHLGSDQVVKTVSGRETSPFPKVKFDTNRKATNTVKAGERWLMQNALDEARARGDEFNARGFEQNLEKPSQADKDSAEMYLFDKDTYQPGNVRKSILKPLTEPAEQPRGYGEKNTVFTSDAAEKARAVLRAKMKGQQMNSGIDPEIIHAGITLAGYHIEAGARSFADFAKAMLGDMGEAVRPFLKMWYNAVRDYPGFDGEDMTPADEITKDAIAAAGKEETDVPDRSANPEQDRKGGAASDQPGEAAVPAGSGETARGAGDRGEKAGEGGSSTKGRARAPDRGAATVGEPSDSELRAAEPDVSGLFTGPVGVERGGDSGDQGIRADHVPAKRVAEAARESTHLKSNSAGADHLHIGQESVDAPPVSNDIERALPTLFPEQRSDVAFAEKRFDQPDGHGVMFTNGTGTGKTFTGGGVIKRLVDAGHKDVMVVAPTQGILNHWKEASEKLGIPLTVLDSTSTAGKGVIGTTYANLGQNRSLADRNWHTVIADESHTLMSQADGNETSALKNFRAITNHPDRLQTRARMQLRVEDDALEQMAGKLKFLEKENMPDAPRVRKEYEQSLIDFDKKVKAKVEEFKKQPRGKAVFLSATPFAYDKNVDYANGYLFDYGPEPKSQGYNTPSAKNAFFMQHFGYRMKYGKLTKPEAAVENDVMERQFHEWMRQQGVLSGRVLNVDKDYDRKFILTNNAEGEKIDQALQWFRDNSKDEAVRALAGAVNKRFDYLSRMRLLEAIKAKDAIPIIKKHMEMGRKVVVFHDYNEGGGFSPFQDDLSPAYQKFVAENPYIPELSAKLAQLGSPLRALTAAFPDALVYNGTVPVKAREQAKVLFNRDAGPSGKHANLIIVQSAAGQAGISLHDTTGAHQRVTINLGMPGRPTTAIQEEGRTYRIGQATDAIFRYMNTGSNWERYTFANRLAERAGTAENLALGDRARTLRQSFVDAFNDSADYTPSAEDGRGGKETDRAMAKATTEFQRAKTFYFAQQKVTGRRDQRAGKDYFATPEPLGQKMVEWANIRPGESVLEPSAGHGAISRFFPIIADRTLVEPSAELASRAALSSPGAKVLNQPFEDLHAVNKYDAIVMNPPFGSGGSTAVEHLAKAAGHLRDGGRIVALIPQGPAADAKFQKFMESDAAKGLYLANDIKLPGVTFTRAGTGAHTHIVILDKQMDPDRAQRIQQSDRDYSDAEDIGKFFDRIEHASVKDRVALPAKTPEETKQQEAISSLMSGRDGKLPAIKPPAELAAGEHAAFTTADIKHTKTGADVFVATLRARVDRDGYTAVNSLAKRFGGYYSSFRGAGAVPGFLFKTAEARTEFMSAFDEQQKPAFSRRSEADSENAPFYSALTKGVESFKQDKAPAQQWAGMIDNLAGVKKEEVDWSGVKDWLAEQKGPVTKAALMDHIRENEVKVQEVTKGKTAAGDVAELERRWNSAADAVNAALARRAPEAEENRLRAVRDGLRDKIDAAQKSGGTKFSTYVLPGGENYRELLLTLPKNEAAAKAAHEAAKARMAATRTDDPAYEARMREVSRTGAEMMNPRGAGEFKSGHWDEPNILAHVRFDDRTGPNGEKVLHIAEVQSDWHQQGRRKGYASSERDIQKLQADVETARQEMLDARNQAFLDATDGKYASNGEMLAGDYSLEEYRRAQQAADADPKLAAAVEKHTNAVTAFKAVRDGVPDAPFKSTWHELAMKRMLRYAAEHGYDRVSWDTGETQADRYDLSKQVDEIRVEKSRSADVNNSSEFMVRLFKGGKEVGNSGMEAAELSNYVGKDLAEKIVKDDLKPGDKKSYSGLDLKVGGEGMKGFYDKILPNFLNKYGKKWGAKVEGSKIIGRASGLGPLRYEGPTATFPQLNELMKWLRGSNESVSVIDQLNRVRGDVASGVGFERAMNDHASPALARHLGGDMNPKIAKPPEHTVHSLPITPAMREGVMQGQPLFAKDRAGRAGERAPGTRVERIGGAKDGADLEFSPAMDHVRDQIMPAIRYQLNKRGMRDFDIKLPDSITALDSGDKAEGLYFKRTIAAALDAKGGVDYAVDHEIIHGLRRSGLITDAEWKILSNKAEKAGWQSRYVDSKSGYSEASPELKMEEAIAHAFPDFVRGKLEPAGNAVTRIFRKISNFFEAVRNAFHGLGFKSADDVFRSIDRGDVGSRGLEDDTNQEPAFARKKKTEEPEEEPAKPLSVSRRVGNLTTDILGKHTEQFFDKISSTVGRFMPESAKEAGKAVQMFLTPMAGGSDPARAAAKDFMNTMRKARVISGRQVDYLAKNFTPDQLERMWSAADEESVLLQQGKTPTPGQGLNRLTPDERAVVETYQGESGTLLKQAIKIGLFKGEGLPSYMPRMAVAIGADGKAGRLKSGDKDVAYGLDALGRNLKTSSSNLRQRKHLLVEDTEKGAQEIDPNAVVIKDVRTLPIAMMRLQEAIAGRTLINQIRQMGADSGELTVSEGVEPPLTNSGHKWFTIDHPAFKTYRPKLLQDEQTGKWKVLKDEDGNDLFEKVPLFIRDDFEGPLRAVLDQKLPMDKIVNSLLTLKGKTMSVIMYSPLMHNAVIWGKAVPAGPLKMINPLWKDAEGKWHVSLEMYGRGHAAKNDPNTMKEALDNGLDPVGHRYFNQDLSAIVEEPSAKAGRSWTSQVLAYVPGLFDKGAGDAVKRAIDKAGDVWHNKFLWDRVGDLQMGLYTHMRDQAIKAGADPQTAGRYAAHFANRYAGALPIESMSKIARQSANLLMFSRSFTLTNLGAFKDLVAGLPRDVQAQVLRDKGVDVLNRIQGTARRKAVAMMAMDIGLSHAGLWLASYALAYALGHAFHPPSQNEPGKEKRFLIGHQADGTAIYGRLPVGKVGEEWQDWITSPADISKRKLSPYGHLLFGVASNDQGFGRKIYDPYDTSAMGYAKNIGRITEYAANSVLPLDAFGSIPNLIKKKGDERTNIAKALLPLVGVTVSKGAPGGEAVGQLYASKDEHEFQVGEEMPDIRDKISSGDIKGAQAEMSKLGMTRAYQKFIIRTTQNPGGRLSKKQMKEFMGYASPDEKAQMKAFLGDDTGTDDGAEPDQHSALEPGDLKSVVASPTKLASAAENGLTWTPEDAAAELHAAGFPATADLLRSSRVSTKFGPRQKLLGSRAAA